jgi:hypothetical protein
MDIYRYFHPHHNPRLRTTPIRLQELNELEEAARELRRAIERAGLRSLREGQRVSFDTEADTRGPKAVNLQAA